MAITGRRLFNAGMGLFFWANSVSSLLEAIREANGDGQKDQNDDVTPKGKVMRSLGYAAMGGLLLWSPVENEKERARKPDSDAAYQNDQSNFELPRSRL
ncbi:MAG TPA: hypothetical protein VLJ15_03630 [Gammaproteobacteria bacterium]|nr:hypothetical protein [Gammaproteobacteria bacterium]